MGRHTSAPGAAASVVPAPGSGRAPGALAPGSRRAARAVTQPVPRRAQSRTAGAGTLGLPNAAAQALRVGVLGAIVLGTGVATVDAVLVDSAEAVTADGGLRTAEAGTLALRSGDSASRSEVVGRLSLEAQGARTFTAVVDGTEQEIITTATTLGEALSEAGIVVGADDLVSAELSGAVPHAERVEIRRVTTEHETVEHVEEFATVEEQDPSLPAGQRVVETKGVVGVASDTYAVRRAGDEEVGRELLASVVRSTKVDEVVRVGTATVPAAPAATAQTYSGSDPRAIGRQLAAERGWGADQFQCLDTLWARESGWDPYADNPYSSAYGIPQALPGSKMASAGADWATNPATQITWGLGYIGGRYGNPCNALAQSYRVGWY
ncbi:MAG: aggregation-promoting factor C-terminal-like domain-containing protein [Georgenia sp.]